MTAAARAASGPAESGPFDDRVPDGLSASDWSSIRAVYEANRHAAFPVAGGWQARNPGQQWITRFDGRGFLTAPDSGEWSWGLELVSYGRANDPSRAREQAGSIREPAFPSREHEEAACIGSRYGPPACVEAAGGRVSYQWDDALTEWYVNDRRGLEHGYTVHRRPEVSRVEASAQHGCAARAEARGSLEEPLTFTLAVRGDLRPRVSGDGRNVTFVDQSGAGM
ncbi:MAG: hypothetical protein DCC66_02635 [Planctomycetota bacterium]|nr:MAG: hypothetical protein DCC66_02635 [Planctomycetota bacterium]